VWDRIEVVQGWTDSWIPTPFAVPSIAGAAGSARRVAAMDRRDREAAQGLCRLSDPPRREAQEHPAAHEAPRGTASGA
jgi:hypothetical protein